VGFPASAGAETCLVLDQGRVHVHDDEPAATPCQPGRGDGHVDAAGEKIVHDEYDEDGNLIGWHKEPK